MKKKSLDKTVTAVMGEQVNVLEHYSFSLPKEVENRYLRPLNEIPEDE